MRKRTYKNFVEGKILYKKFYDSHNLPYPQLSLTSYEEYISIADKSYWEYCCNEIYELVRKQRFFLYLFIITLKDNYSTKLFDYYKIWKRYRDIPLLEKGIENKYNLNEKEIYVSCGRFDIQNISIILKYLFENPSKMFIFCTWNKALQDNIEMYNSLCNQENLLNNSEYFGFKQLFEEMEIEETIIQSSFDGEEIGIDIFRKE